ncbi:unnamed protein product [Clonostachys byssicola]|uniref:Uncharacterized protein n=1 Tax=Clonostachys byssicola TaxID=160290 RepID=A0A9N9UIW1_9HYPO|nr:unnamed protein product [Clonostachys byssicola]
MQDPDSTEVAGLFQEFGNSAAVPQGVDSHFAPASPGDLSRLSVQAKSAADISSAFGFANPEGQSVFPGPHEELPPDMFFDYSLLESILPLTQTDNTCTGESQGASPVRHIAAAAAAFPRALKPPSLGMGSESQTFALNSSSSWHINLPRPTSPALSTDSDPQEVSDLLNHYRTHVCKLMMPTIAPSQNPWLRLYLPMASREPQTAAKKCLLHAILAVAAFNKSELSRADRGQYQQLARTLKDRAALMIKDVLADASQREALLQNDVDRQALLAAAMTMTTVEVFSGGNEGRGYENIALCKYIIRLTGGVTWWVASSTRMTLLQIFRCLELVARTSGWTNNDESEQVQDDEQATPESRSAQPLGDSVRHSSSDVEFLMGTSAPQYTLDVSFGIAMKTLRCLSQTIELCSIRESMKSGKGWSERSAVALQQLEAELFDTLEDPDAFSGQEVLGDVSQEGVSDYVSREIKENHCWAFHCSATIFFRRAICEGGSKVTPPIEGLAADKDGSRSRPTGQQLVSMALEHLENVDAMSSDMAIANTLWPGFIAAVEAIDMDLRHRSLIWFARARRHGIGNIAKAKALVMEVWRRVDRQTGAGSDRQHMNSELSHVDWREIMREKGMYIMLT